jgi:uncharacterized membrane-anchored protein
MQTGHWRLMAATAVLALSAAAAQADEAAASSSARLTPAQQAEVERIRTIGRNLHPVWGDVKLPGVDATLHLGKDYYYLNPQEARTVIVDAWGNPPDNGKDQLGLIFPKGGDFINGWGAIVTYQKTGYVEDKDAETADYGKLIEEVHKGEEAENAERK